MEARPENKTFTHLGCTKCCVFKIAHPRDDVLHIFVQELDGVVQGVGDLLSLSGLR